MRPYTDFNWRGRLIKASIPIRNSVLWRSLFIFPKRMVRQVSFLAGVRFRKFRYRKLQPNHDVYWEADADACNSIDPHDAILWFLSNGFECVSHATTLSRFMVRSGPLVFRKSR